MIILIFIIGNRSFKMYSSKLKAFLIIFTSIFILTLIITFISGSQRVIFASIYLTFCFLFMVYLLGIHKILINYFDNKAYAKQDEINFQTNLRRELQRKRALSEIDNENLHYQNQLKIEYIAQVAQIHLQSNQYLANMYQQAIINNSTQNELTAQKQLQELEAELQKQGLI